jgi:hypothetical protein
MAYGGIELDVFKEISAAEKRSRKIVVNVGRYDRM